MESIARSKSIESQVRRREKESAQLSGIIEIELLLSSEKFMCVDFHVVLNEHDLLAFLWRELLQLLRRDFEDISQCILRYGL